MFIKLQFSKNGLSFVNTIQLIVVRILIYNVSSLNSRFYISLHLKYCVSLTTKILDKKRI